MHRKCSVSRGNCELTFSSTWLNVNNYWTVAITTQKIKSWISESVWFLGSILKHLRVQRSLEVPWVYEFPAPSTPGTHPQGTPRGARGQLAGPCACLRGLRPQLPGPQLFSWVVFTKSSEFCLFVGGIFLFGEKMCCILINIYTLWWIIQHLRLGQPLSRYK